MCQFPSLFKPFQKVTPYFLCRKYYCLISLTGLNLSTSSWLILEYIPQHHLPYSPLCKKYLTSQLYLLFTLSYTNNMPFTKDAAPEKPIYPVSPCFCCHSCKVPCFWDHFIGNTMSSLYIYFCISPPLAL